ncbi:nuclear transport factor 2 family protein [Kitasatospora sp. NBC_01287]|uniref:nuclear transport factor 2 family protein n=1 Tax=Kitasatospora sp. NBC_01287 TaxID=2903573 RepID=UPI00225B4D2B|nr:nuclear transport factor 2 family protein [Kitasatospora sp. NBC_01287]MCX4745006.1 nuclear transport factor 2 family protein [Kitasatospora sp. NBC_01287]
MTQFSAPADQEEIRRLLALFSHAFDNADAELIAEVFAPDGTIELARTGARFEGLAAIQAFSRDLGATSPDHHTLDTVLTPQPDGTVRARSRYLAILADGSVHNGDYFDVLVRTDQGWRIAERRSVPRYPAAVHPNE